MKNRIIVIAIVRCVKLIENSCNQILYDEMSTYEDELAEVTPLGFQLTIFEKKNMYSNISPWLSH